MLVHELRRGCIACTAGVLAGSFSARADVLGSLDAERRDARCINAYNIKAPPFDVPAPLDKNPTLARFQIDAGVGKAFGASTAGRVDVDGVVPLAVLYPSPGDSVFGISLGVSAEARRYHRDRSLYDVEVRLGIARRVYDVGYSVLAGGCRPRRIDLFFGMVKWNAGQFSTQTSSGGPAGFASTVGLFDIGWGYNYPLRSWKLGLTLLAFRVAPEFGGGAPGAAYAEYVYEGLVVSARASFSWFDPVDASISLGVGFATN